MSPHPPPLLYREVQRFAGALSIGLLGFAVGTSVFVARYAGTQFLPLVALGVLSLAFVALGRLEIEVRVGEVRARFLPFQLSFRRFPVEEIASAEARRYQPIREYGGWGLRGRGANRALNVRGDHGVQLVFRDGRRLLLGSQRADELAAAIARARPAPGGATPSPSP